MEDDPSSKFPIYHQTHDQLAESLRGITDFAQLGPILDMRESLPSAFDSIFKMPSLEGVDRGRLFASVKRWALDALADGPNLVRRTAPSKAPLATDELTFTAAECRGILANAFIGNVRDPMSFAKTNKGGLDFCRQLRGHGVGAQKTAALLLYFEAGLRLEGSDDDERECIFQHIRCLDVHKMEGLLEGSSATLLSCREDGAADGAAVNLHSGTMEDPAHADAFVNFANPNFGYGCFIPSCTQEEILQMCCPEFNVGMLFIGIMAEDEVVNVRNCRRFTQYTGYLDSFQVTGALGADNVQCILTLDACTQRHFGRHSLLRDISKAYSSFAALHRGHHSGNRAPVVSTGRWGCGVFGGTPAHKFCQQLLAAQLAGVSLEFSMFGTPDGCDDAASRCQGATVQQLWKLLRHSSDRRSFEAGLLTMKRTHSIATIQENLSGVAGPSGSNNGTIATSWEGPSYDSASSHRNRSPPPGYWDEV